MKNVLRIIFLYFFFAGLSFSFFSDITKVAAQNGQPPVLLSTFDVDATPPVGSQLTYGPMIKSWDLGLRARGIVLQGAGKPIVLCSVDWIGIANGGQDAFKEALAEAAGTTPDRVAVHTIHQHDAPICDFTAEEILKKEGISPGCFEGSFARELIQNLSKAIQKSLDDSRPVSHISYGEAPVYKVASNRRILNNEGKVGSSRGSSCKDSFLIAQPEGIIDSMVSVIGFWEEETPVALLSFYATHPQSYYLTQVANPDFPGLARFYRQLEMPGALHVHFNGAGGNVAAGKYNDGSKENRRILAERLADGMKRAWEDSKKMKITPKQVQWNTQAVDLPPALNILEEIEAKMGDEDLPFNYLPNNMGKLAWIKRYQAGKKIELNCLRLGKTRLLFMPGELFVEYQLAAKAMRPDLFVTMAGYGDYGPFYIGTKAAYKQGGYEIETSPVTDKAEDIMMEGMHKLLNANP
ncbi:hypothetical protein [Mariniphaga sediminis]|uniref:hypothetical protein n=1 Tax=Mariniphaga sediminis TaxID=1628158 RepID=UPI0019D4D302|nr:hypothetical protein [Mariniphaga sediminis]